MGHSGLHLAPGVRAGFAFGFGMPLPCDSKEVTCCSCCVMMQLFVSVLGHLLPAAPCCWAACKMNTELGGLASLAPRAHRPVPRLRNLLSIWFYSEQVHAANHVAMSRWRVTCNTGVCIVRLLISSMPGTDDAMTCRSASTGMIITWHRACCFTDKFIRAQSIIDSVSPE